MSEILKGVKKERLAKPMRLIPYGVDGVGKSQFAAHAPEPIFIGAEDGTAELEVARYPVEPKEWSHIFDAVETLENENHEFKTFCLDTVDFAEPLCWRHVCEMNGWKSMDASPYNSAFNVAQAEWRRLLAALDRLRARKGMHIILIGHSTVRTFRNPEGEDYDKYALKLHEKSASILREWADAVLFCAFETYTAENKSKRTYGTSSGARIIHTERQPAFDAKNRYNLPARLALDWAEFEAAVKARETATPAELRARIEKMLGAIGDAGFTATATTVMTKAANDAVELSKIANKVAARLGRKQREEEAA